MMHLSQTMTPPVMQQFCCPKCGKLILKYRSDLSGMQELACPRTGKAPNGEPCRWRDEVYFNSTPESGGTASG